MQLKMLERKGAKRHFKLHLPTNPDPSVNLSKTYVVTFFGAVLVRFFC